MYLLREEMLVSQMFFILSKKGITKTNGCKLRLDTVKLEKRHRFLTVKGINYYSRLSREMIYSAYPVVFWLG